MLDVTIVYPAGRPSFWGFMCGRIPVIVVNVRERPLPADIIGGSYTYLDDPEFRERFQAWVRSFWDEKDFLIERLLAESPRARTCSTATESV
jgi:hypothetical protein